MKVRYLYLWGVSTSGVGERFLWLEGDLYPRGRDEHQRSFFREVIYGLVANCKYQILLERV